MAMPAVPASRPGADRALTRLVPLVSAAGAAIVILAFHSTGIAYYDQFRVPQGYGMDFLLPNEVVHYVLYVVFGVSAAVLLTVALAATALPARLRRAFEACARRPRLSAALAAVAITGACLAVSVEFLGDGILTDDEHVYRFIAQTLRTGSLTAPSPGTDLDFFFEQFVVLTDKVRYGKYPIGFPLALAAGQALHAERAVVPVLTGLLALLVAWVGLAEFGSAVTILALLLYVLSPQVIVTGGATLFSQAVSAPCLMGALGCLSAAGRGRRHTAAWLAAAGALLSYGVLARPLPGVLFCGVVFLALAAGPRFGLVGRLTIREWIAFLAPLAVGPALLLWINYRQSGHPFHSGYHALHSDDWGPTLLFHGTVAMWAMSLVSNVVRLNFWLFGWPLSLLPCLWARRTPFTLVCWGTVGAEVLYRFLSAKAGVGHAGPLYVYEIVPVLCVLSADGLLALAARGRRALRGSGWRVVRPDVLAAALVSLTVVNLALFLPYKLADISRSAYAQQEVFRQLRQKGVHHAVVFHRTIVPAWLSWAYFPPPNSPRLDDDVLFICLKNGADHLPQIVDFWKRRFPDREAWVFGWDKETGPFLVPFTSYIRSADLSGYPLKGPR